MKNLKLILALIFVVLIVSLLFTKANRFIIWKNNSKYSNWQTNEYISNWNCLDDLPLYEGRVWADELNYEKGGKVLITVEFDFSNSILLNNMKSHLDDADSVYVALSAERVYDAEGNPHRFNNMHMSTLLTPSGVPIENVSENIPHSKLQGPYRSVFEMYQEKEISQVRISPESGSISFELEGIVPEDVPDGYYRFEIEGGIVSGGKHMKWELLPLRTSVLASRSLALSGVIGIYNIEMHISGTRQHHYSSVFRLGKPAAPRMIWTLFANEYSYNNRGVVADEDKDRFGFNINGVGPTFPIYPMRNHDGTYREYNLEPDFPLLNPLNVFPQDYIGSYEVLSVLRDDPINLDYTTGEWEVVVQTPSGKIENLGNHGFRKKTETGASTGTGKYRYIFKEYGEYIIKTDGWIKDVWGNKYTGGGTYKIWIAEPLSFSTSTKPGMPFPEGYAFSTRVSVHPPVPADMDFKVWLYRKSNPDDVKFMEYQGKANRYGYHFAPSGMVLDSEGEYKSIITAKYIDKQGRLWMGAAINSSIVYKKDYDLKVHGDPYAPQSQNFQSHRFHTMKESFAIFDIAANTSMVGHSVRLNFPYNSQDVLLLANPESESVTTLFSLLTFEDNTGFWENKILDSIPPLNDYLFENYQEKIEIDTKKWSYSQPMAVNDSFLYGFPTLYAFHKDRKTLPVVPLSKDMVQPYSYPEKITVMCYFYSSSVRPGLVAVRQVQDSTQIRNYWIPTLNSFNRKLGYVANGDQPAEHYRMMGGVVCRDLETGQYANGPYQGSLVFTESGYNDDRTVASLSEPLFTFSGREMYALIGSSPEPGTIYETGDLISQGGFVIPAVPIEYYWSVEKPDGESITYRGRANEFGITIPKPNVIPADKPGVYKVTQKLGKDGELGGVAGTIDDTFNIYCAVEDSPYNIRFDNPPMSIFEDVENGTTISGHVPDDFSNPELFYSIIMPGCVISEGTLPLDDKNHFNLDFRPLDANMRCPFYDVQFMDKGVPIFSDKVEFVFFSQGTDKDGNIVTAAGQAGIESNRLFTGSIDEMPASRKTDKSRPGYSMMANPGMAEDFYAPGMVMDESSKTSSPGNHMAAPSMHQNDEKTGKGNIENIEKFCSSCHDREDVLGMKRDYGEWRRIMNFHLGKHPLILTKEEREKTLELLFKDYSTIWPADDKRSSELQAGETIFKNRCVSCHDESFVLGVKKYRSGWRNNIEVMNRKFEDLQVENNINSLENRTRCYACHVAEREIPRRKSNFEHPVSFVDNVVRLNDIVPVPLTDEEKTNVLEFLAWRQARESTLEDVKETSIDNEWGKQRRQFQKVCFDCHAIPFMMEKPWPDDPGAFITGHLEYVKPDISDEAVKEISAYLKFLKTTN